MCVHIADSLSYSRNWYNIVKQLYSDKIFFKKRERKNSGGEVSAQSLQTSRRQPGSPGLGWEQGQGEGKCVCRSVEA